MKSTIKWKLMLKLLKMQDQIHLLNSLLIKKKKMIDWLIHSFIYSRDKNKHITLENNNYTVLLRHQSTIIDTRSKAI